MYDLHFTRDNGKVQQKETTADIVPDHREPQRHTNLGVNSGTEIHSASLKKVKKKPMDKTRFAQIHMLLPSLIS